MPATITITCPHCQSQLKGPAGLEGKKVRCKGCGQSFVITASVLENSAPLAAPGRANVGSNATSSPATASPAALPPKSGGGPGVYAFISDEEAEKAMIEAKTKAPPPTDVKTLKGQKHFGSDGKPYSLTDMSLAPRCPYCATELPSEDTIVCLHCGYNLQTRTRLEPKHTYDITPAERFSVAAVRIYRRCTRRVLSGVHRLSVARTGPASGGQQGVVDDLCGTLVRDLGLRLRRLHDLARLPPRLPPPRAQPRPAGGREEVRARSELQGNHKKHQEHEEPGMSPALRQNLVFTTRTAWPLTIDITAG